MVKPSLTSLTVIHKAIQEGDLDDVLGNFCNMEFHKNNLRCAEVMRAGAVEQAKEYAYSANVYEGLLKDFKRYVDEQLRAR